jgi:hypothetical protein
MCICSTDPALSSGGAHKCKDRKRHLPTACTECRHKTTNTDDDSRKKGSRSYGSRLSNSSNHSSRFSRGLVHIVPIVPGVRVVKDQAIKLRKSFFFACSARVARQRKQPNKFYLPKETGIIRLVRTIPPRWLGEKHEQGREQTDGGENAKRNGVALG